MKRLYEELQRKLHHFGNASAAKTIHLKTCMWEVRSATPPRDSVDRFMEWYNHRRPHMSLDWDNLETPAQAFYRKIPPKGQVVVDKQTREEYRVE